MNKTTLAFISGSIGLILAGCGGFVYTTVGGTVKGLGSGDSLVLRNDANYTKTLTADGTFAFNVASNGSYAISILTQPNSVSCALTNGTGTMTGDAAVTNVSVNCVPNVPVAGTLSGMSDGSTIILSNNATSTLTLSANGAFQFASYVVSGNPYSVAVSTPPAGQFCTVANGAGTVNNSNLLSGSNVAVTCAPAVPVKFTVSGLTSGSTLVMADTAIGIVDKYAVTADGTYSFNWSLLTGANYSASVDTQPSGQTCTVSNGAGVADLANPTGASNIAVKCVKN
ncbi:hypothetical protein ACO0LB_09485 [Undibacterium sp. SXout7W]|uniref:hypothetical protein n=1 Tax=Undibacterium sp. SXout7W TaxID=3413049 RepID=UPI003BF37E2C